jgi:hypothetical protein
MRCSSACGTRGFACGSCGGAEKSSSRRPPVGRNLCSRSRGDRVTNIPERECQTRPNLGGRPAPLGPLPSVPIAAPSFRPSDNKSRETRMRQSCVGAVKARERSGSFSPTEVNTQEPPTAGACRRRARAFADRDRANHQVMGTRTHTCAFGPKNCGRSERASRHKKKTQMIPYRYPTEARMGVRERPRGVRPRARNSSLISMTFTSGLPAQLLARKRL